MRDLLITTDKGLYCPAGEFYIDPWKSVDMAITTHAHSDHARPGSNRYLTANPGVAILRQRVQASAQIQGLDYGQAIHIRGVRVSLHPAGHILGSAQVRVEVGGEVWVVSGDYKTDPDPTCTPFEPVECHTFVTESTFGLPVYRWPEPVGVFEQINRWWRQNQTAGRTSVLYAYSLGKNQRLLNGVDASIGPIGVHAAAKPFIDAYSEAGVRMPEVVVAKTGSAAGLAGRGLVLVPGGSDQGWMSELGPMSVGTASGWMQTRAGRKRQNLDAGFVLSDHADWPGLLSAIKATGAGRVLVTHGFVAILVRYLREIGVEAAELKGAWKADESAIEEE